MPRRRFFVPREQICDGIALLPQDQAHHLRTVLRLKPGDEVEVFDGEGTGYLGRVESCIPEVRIRLRDVAYRVEQPAARVSLAAALIKADRFEWLIQKATELGVEEIIPLRTRFCGIRVSPDRLDLRLERWHRIAREASKQCRRLSVPMVSQPREFGELLSSEHMSDNTRILFYEKASIPLSRAGALSGRILICTGPEGGWDPAEVDEASRAGFSIFRLGPHILRAETAAIAALAIVQFASEMRR